MRIRVVAAIGFVLSTLLLASCGATKSSAVRPCAPNVVDGVIPSWAQAGFLERNPTMHYELGTSREIVALLFAFPLESPPPASHNNKILWVSRSEERRVGTEWRSW